MTATKFDDNDLRAAARRAMTTLAGPSHPEPGELLSYHAGELGDSERERVLNHLAACPECTRVVLDMASFPELEPRDPQLARSDEDADALWQQMRQRLRDEDAPAPVLHPRPQAPSRGWRPGFSQMLAAALVLLTLGLSWALLSERRAVRDAAAPRLNLLVAELAPVADAGSRGEAEDVRLPPGSDGVFLSLALVEPRDFASYELEAVSENDGRTVWRSSDLQKNPQGIFAIDLPHGFLPAGAYRLELRGLDRDRREPLATYRLTLEYE